MPAWQISTYHAHVLALRSLRNLIAESLRLQWSTLRTDAWLYCLPVNTAVLAVGLTLHQLRPAVAIVAAAVSVGFGAFHQLTRFRLLPMLIATLGFSISAWVGAVVGHINLACSILVAIIWGAVFGGLTELGQGAWWIGLQCVIALFVSSAYPAQPWPATQRVLLILLGGALQIIWTLLLWRWRREPLIAQKIFEPLNWNLAPTRFFGIPHPLGDAGARYALRVAAVLAVAVLVEHLSPWSNTYWIPMTAAIVLKTDFRTTFTRGIARLVGTIIGAALTTAVAALLRPPPVVLAAILLLALCGCFSFQKVNYGLFSLFITTYVVLLLSLLGLPAPELALHRTLGTSIGGALALLCFVIVRPAKVSNDEPPTVRDSQPSKAAPLAP